MALGVNTRDLSAARTSGFKPIKWANEHRVATGTMVLSAMAFALGIALVAYMHFSGLGLSTAGFTALGVKLTALGNLIGKQFVTLGHIVEKSMTSIQHLSKWQLVAICTGAFVAGPVLFIAGTTSLGACMKKLEARKEQQARRAVQVLRPVSAIQLKNVIGS
ncbi:MAG: hypothetical protein S4CHLAM2_16390 [Chlamydiales bacterium]|nr:hypothetical protein [Chlamydiales bacterium]